MSDAAYAAAAVVSDMLGDPVAAAPAEPVAEQAAPEPVADSVPELPTWTADTSGLDFLDDPEPEPLYDDDPEPPQEDEPEDIEYASDPEVAKLKAQVKKLEKQTAWERQQRVKVSERQWRDEAKRRFPLADVDELKADSRRAFLRKAHEQHSRVERKIKPVVDALEALRAETVASARQEARQEAQAAYGRPLTGPSTGLVEAAEHSARTQEIRKPTGNLIDSVKARLAGTNHLGLTEGG